MDIFKRRGLTRADVFLLFSACTFPVFLWAFINIFYGMPSFVLRLTVPEIIGASAYFLAFALLESILYFGVLLLILSLIALLLPRRWFGDHFIAFGGWLALLIAAIAMLMQVGSDWLTALSARRSLFYLGLTVVTGLGYLFAVFRFSRFESFIRAVFQRLSMLAMLYAFFGVASLLIIIFRNL